MNMWQEGRHLLANNTRDTYLKWKVVDICRSLIYQGIKAKNHKFFHNSGRNMRIYVEVKKYLTNNCGIYFSFSLEKAVTE